MPNGQQQAIICIWMLSALRWVKTNIKDYGGDPTNVTIFGESAGGLSVVNRSALRGSHGLFRTIISQSALDSPGTISSYYDMTTALDNSTLIANRLNCTNQNQDILSCLRNVSVNNLLSVYGTGRTRPILDKYFFPLYPPLAIQEGLYGNVSLIIGNNYYELPICTLSPNMSFIEALALISDYVEEKWIAPIVDSYGLYGCFSDRNHNNTRCCDIARVILMDQIFDCDIIRILDAFFLRNQQINAGNQLFWYNLNCYPGICPQVGHKGVCLHGSEQAYVFGTESDWSSIKPINCNWDNQSRTFSNNIIAHWIHTANTGKPLSSWPDYLPFTKKFYRLTPDQGFFNDTWSRNCTLFDAIENQRLRKFIEKNHQFHF